MWAEWRPSGEIRCVTRGATIGGSSAPVSVSASKARRGTRVIPRMPRVRRGDCRLDGTQASSGGIETGRSNELVDHVLEHLLPAADVAGHLALGQDVGFQVGEAGLAGLD